MKKLNLCCGNDKREGYIGIDISPDSKADIVHNLNTFPYPFNDNEFDHIICVDAIEHLDDIIKVMEEIHRISKNGTEIYIRVPHFSSVQAFTDPTHKHFFGLQSFDYFTIEEERYNFYSKVFYKKKKIRLNFWKLHRLTGIAELMKLIPGYYEKLFAFIFPCENIEFTLEVIK